MVGSVLPGLGYETLIAYDGKSALEIIRKHHRFIDLMLLDLQLPDTTGLDLLRQLSRDGLNLTTILVTAHGSEQVAVDAFRLGVDNYLKKPFDLDELNLAISNALTESRLRHETRRLTAQLQEQVSWLTALSQVGKSVTSTLDVDDVLRRIVDSSVRLSKAEEGFLALFDGNNEQLYLRAVKNIAEEKIKTMRLPVIDSLIGQALNGGRPIRTNQSMSGMPLKVSTGYLVYSLMHVPILSHGKPLGVLSVDNRGTDRPFTETDESILTSLADYAAVALENANLYEQARQEIDERMRVEVALRESEERYALAMRGANDGLWDWNLKTQRIYYSSRWKSMLGYEEKEITDSPNEWFSRIHPDDIERTKREIAAHTKHMTTHFENEHRIEHRIGEYHWVLSRGVAIWDEDGKAVRMVGSMADITDRKLAEERLLFDAFHDTLTGLANRALLMERLRFSIERFKRSAKNQFALLFMDVDRFKDINDSLGHMVGDNLLKAVGEALTSILRPTDTVARLGGDEFVILLDEISDASDATRVADRVQRELAMIHGQVGHAVYITASIGIVLSATGYQNAEDVLRDADIAMYRAKAHGKARYEIFDPAMRDRIMERLVLENELRQAIVRDELRVYYQPIVSLKDDSILGYEALVRWQHPTRGLLPPIDFIPLAEDTGLIIPIDRWVMREACRQIYEWHHEMQMDPPLKISVNISGKHIVQPDLVERIKQILHDTHLDASDLHLEITESVIMDNYDLTSEVLDQLKQLGVKLQVDDFGVGYSSLSYLSRFPLDALKIDRTFVSKMSQDNTHMKIVQAIVMMTHGLGMGVIAEGVETEQQLDQLRSLGCESIQGFLVARPLDEVSAFDLLRRSRENGEKRPPWKLGK